MKALYKGLYTLFADDSTAVANLSGGLHKADAPEGVTFPYAVMTMPSNRRADQLNEKFRDLAIQINIFSESDTADEASDLADELEALFDDSAPTVTGWTVHFVKFDMSTAPQTPDEGIYQYTLRFMVLLQESA